MRKPLGMVFDHGDTILNTKADFIAGNRRILELADGEVSLTAEEIQVVADEINEEIETIRNSTMVEFGIQTFQRLLYDHLGISFNASPAELEREFIRAAVVTTPADGIYEVLDKLDERGIKTGILSNTSASGSLLMEELAEHNLAHRFSFLISSADYGFRKPHPRIFKLAAAKLGLEPEDIWFAGDKPEYDIKGAIDSGMFPVWYNPQGRPGSIQGDFLEVKSWYEFIDRLESLYNS